tara:strand:+ start:3572 stop:4624 length:1053 start_codon:yes stop_codon:yes gene_type:complete
MAFLDNSGGIILDAVLTEKGRKLMATGGGISISKFALGDDEINYGLFDKGHASGSAYYDLEILQTPVFEAVTQINANINYGLLTFNNPNLLYMPEFVQNTKDNAANFATPHQKLFYVAVNTETVDAMLASTYLFKNNPEKVIQAGSTSHRAITYELGLNTSEIAKNQTTKNQYIDSIGIKDQSYVISVNSLFITAVLGLGNNANKYANKLSDNSLGSYPSSRDLISTGAGANSKNRINYRDHSTKGSPAYIFEPNNASSTASTYSVISGPSNSIILFNVGVAAGMDHSKAGVRDRKYTQYGKTSQTAQQAFGASSGDGNTYDYIDTAVYLEANTTGAQISVPIRLIRRAS